MSSFLAPAPASAMDDDDEVRRMIAEFNGGGDGSSSSSSSDGENVEPQQEREHSEASDIEASARGGRRRRKREEDDVSEEEDDGVARDSDSDGYDECFSDAMGGGGDSSCDEDDENRGGGGGGGGGGGEEMMDDKENDAAAAAAAGAAPLYVGDVGDELDVQYKRLLQRYLLGNRSPYKVLLDELDIDVTLCEEEATSNAAANEGKKGYARPENALRKLKEMLDEIVNLELAMHRRHVNMRKPEDIFFNANKVHDGAVAESFNQMRHLLDLMLQHTETTIKMRRISSGVNVPMSLDELIRNYRSERNKQNATLKAITFFLEQAASRRLRKLSPS